MFSPLRFLGTVADAFCTHPDHMGEALTSQYIPAKETQKLSLLPPREAASSTNPTSLKRTSSALEEGCLPRSTRPKVTPRTRSPSPSPFTHQPPAAQMEQFPAFEHNASDWQDWKQSNNSVDVNEPNINHCLQHCAHTICRDIISQNQRRDIEPKPCTCSHLPLLDEITFDQERISRLRLQDILAAQKAYKRASDQKTITLDLHSATALVEKLREKGYLDVKNYLRACPHFTKNTTLFDAQYPAATRAANELVSKLLAYLSTMLSDVQNKSRTLPVGEIEEEIQAAMRSEMFWWVAEWCHHNRVKRTHDAAEKAFCLWPGWSFARRRWVEGEMKEGVEVVFERVERVVGLVVAVLFWWGKRVEDGSDEGGSEEGDPGSLWRAFGTGSNSSGDFLSE